MKKYFLTILIMIVSMSAQASWKMKSAYKPVPGLEVERSVLYFTSGDKTKVYTPNEIPWGLVDSKKYVTIKGEFYLTSWVQGAQSVMFRVFDMSMEKAEPVCEVISFGETSKLKLKDGVLYLQKFDNLDQVKPEWKACAKISSRP